MADQSVTTSIDDLVKYLNEHGETESSKLAEALGVGESIVEIWADALEKAGITKINYKVGKMFIAPVAATTVGVEEAKKTVELKKGIASAEISAQMTLVKQVTAKIEEFKKYQAGAEEAYRSRAGEVKTALDSINRLDSQLEAAYRRLKGRKDYIDGLISELNKSMAALGGRAGAAKEVGRNEEAKALIADMRERIKDADEMVGKMDKEFSTAVASSRRSFSEMLDGLRDESARMKRLVFQRQKELEELESQSKSYERGSEALRRRASRERERMLDEIAKASGEVGAAYASATNRINSLRVVLAELKGRFGGLADLGDRLNKINEEVDSAEKERNAIAKQLGELSEQLKAMSALDKQHTAEERETEMEDLNKKLSENTKRIGKTDEGLGKIKKDMDEISK